MNIFICGLIQIFGVAAFAASPVTSAPFSIQQIRTGWASDSIAIVPPGSSVPAANNPAGCTNVDGYMTDSTQPGYKTYYAAAMLASALNKQVQVVISPSACVATRPQIWGVYVNF